MRYDAVALGTAQVGTSIALDVLILALPLPMIASLHMKTERKVAIGIIFWLGGL